MGEALFLSILLLICGVFFYLTFGFKVSILDTSGGAALFPRIVIVFLAAVLIVRLLQLRKEKKEHFVFLELFHGYRLFFLLALAGYILLFKPLGYILSTSLFLIVTINVFYHASRHESGGVKSILLRNGLAAAFAVGLYFFFAKVVHIMLPAGLLG